ncbi:MAG: PEPxxWA-CTERM sorting domain-containing protein [Polymorphobacter sp.]|uniref:PEPxxWA-CTERM sorting domain-containing protein n=1 Tax=Polymorphobacter sp. TaxID=1909290 RepID=UPI003A83B075
MKAYLLTATAALFIAASPAAAVTNLIVNGSFEDGSPGTGGFVGWTKSNTPTDLPASVISYNVTLPYPLGAFGEAVTPDNLATSNSPDAVGNQAAYFVSDFAVDESISQSTFLTPGRYEVGFSFYLPQNGLNNAGNSSFTATVLGQTIATTNITAASLGQTWLLASGEVVITTAGNYDTTFSFNSNFRPSKDIVIDRVYAVAVPEPASWAMLIAGFGLVGSTMRRRRTTTARVLA